MLLAILPRSENARYLISSGARISLGHVRGGSACDTGKQEAPITLDSDRVQGNEMSDAFRGIGVRKGCVS